MTGDAINITEAYIKLGYTSDGRAELLAKMADQIRARKVTGPLYRDFKNLGPEKMPLEEKLAEVLDEVVLRLSKKVDNLPEIEEGAWDADFIMRLAEAGLFSKRLTTALNTKYGDPLFDINEIDSKTKEFARGYGMQSTWEVMIVNEIRNHTDRFTNLAPHSAAPAIRENIETNVDIADAYAQLGYTSEGRADLLKAVADRIRTRKLVGTLYRDIKVNHDQMPLEEKLQGVIDGVVVRLSQRINNDPKIATESTNSLVKMAELGLFSSHLTKSLPERLGYPNTTDNIDEIDGHTTALRWYHGRQSTWEMIIVDEIRKHTDAFKNLAPHPVSLSAGNIQTGFKAANSALASPSEATAELPEFDPASGQLFTKEI